MLVSSHSQLIISKIGGYHAGQTIMMVNSGAKPSDLLREQAKDAANKCMFVTAGFIAEQITRGPDVQISDLIFFAKCFYLQNQPRRCLAALEQRGLLSAHNTQLLSDALLTVADFPVHSHESDTGPLSGSNFTDLVAAFQLAARCLFSLEEYEDCVTLLGPLVSLDVDKDDEDNLLIGCTTAVKRAKVIFQRSVEKMSNQLNQASASSSGATSGPVTKEINPMSGIYNTIGQCYDQLDNRPRAVKALVAALTIDSACTEAAEYLVTHGLLSVPERRALIADKLDLSNGRAWLEGYYRFSLLGESINTAANGRGDRCHSPERGVTSVPKCQIMWEPSSAEWMARNAEHLYDRMLPEEAYRFARQAYTSDPFDSRGLLVYIACLLELRMKTELFYLAHELSSMYPKMAISWYAVGCYYLCCSKPEAAQKHLQRATKIDKRFAKAWVALGQSLSAQEESEHAIAAFRAACRLLPRDHRPMVLMAKELVRTNYLSLALHLLIGALQISSKDAVALNEMGVIYIRLDRLEDALSYFSQAVDATTSYMSDNTATSGSGSGSGCARVTVEVYSNYATALRKCDRFEEALSWYHKCLGLSPSDPNTHASIAFTRHLMKDFDGAMISYHRALSLQPTFAFCIDMLDRAMADSISSINMSPMTSSREPLGAALERHQFSMLKDGQTDNSVDDCALSNMLGREDSLSFLRAM